MLGEMASFREVFRLQPEDHGIFVRVGILRGLCRPPSIVAGVAAENSPDPWVRATCYGFPSSSSSIEDKSAKVRLSSPRSFLQSPYKCTELVVPLRGLLRLVQFLPIVAANIGGDRRRRVDDHLMRPFQLGWPAGSSRFSGKVRHDNDVACRVYLDRHRPHHLIEVERIDIGVDNDDNLGIARAHVWWSARASRWPWQSRHSASSWKR